MSWLTWFALYSTFMAAIAVVLGVAEVRRLVRWQRANPEQFALQEVLWRRCVRILQIVLVVTSLACAANVVMLLS